MYKFMNRVMPIVLIAAGLAVPFGFSFAPESILAGGGIAGVGILGIIIPRISS